MITLLLACFASLYAATLDQPPSAAKNSVSEIMRRPASARLQGASAGERGEAETQTQIGVDKVVTRVRTALEAVVRAHGELTALELAADPRGLVISLPEVGSFPIGRAEPTPAAELILTQIASVLAGEASSIRVEGHTDDLPIRSPEFASNWELSTARATHVVQFLVERGGLPPARLSAAGYGEFKPRVANDTPAARARNRRVDIVVLNADTMRAEEPPAKGQR